jgi:hypothetical protein
MLIRMLLAGSLVFAAAGFAQQPPPPRFRGGMGGARFLGAEAGMPGRVVTNAPYSADIVTDTTQVLPDGNHIHQTNTTKAYRDSAGRTRREQALNNLNGLAPGSSLPHVVFIRDPVAGLNYALNPSNHTATRSASMRPAGAGQGRGSGRGGNRNMMQGRAARANNPNLKTESLGTQIIDGVSANGTRTTLTIPAGKIGNDQPLQIVTETWYSPDLQTVVLSKRSDPRSGDTVMQFTNINRAEPAAAMFDVPSDYTVTDAPRVRMGAPRN